MSFRRAILGPALVFLLSIPLCAALVELVGQHTILARKVSYLRNIDHRMKPHSNGTNSDGIRTEAEPDAFRDEDWNVVILGDSFVFGAGVNREEAIPQLVEEIAAARDSASGALIADSSGPRVRTANFGWTSSSPLLGYRLLKSIGAKYHPDVVAYCVDMTDMHDDLKYQKLLERKGVFAMVAYAPVTFLMFHEVIALTPGLAGLHERIFGFPPRRFFATDAPLEQTEKYFSPIRANIDSIDAYCRTELGARFVLFVFPRSFQYSAREAPHNWERAQYKVLGPYSLEPFRYFERMKGEVRYPVHSLLPDFQNTAVFPTCLDDDPHWNEQGYRVAAEAIVRYLVQDGLLPQRKEKIDG